MVARRMILVGDPTSHGGTVTTGSPYSDVEGKAVARLGDEVSCPQHGPNKIVEGESTYHVDNLPAAIEGHRTECGALLIGSCNNVVG